MTEVQEREGFSVGDRVRWTRTYAWRPEHLKHSVDVEVELSGTITKFYDPGDERQQRLTLIPTWGAYVLIDAKAIDRMRFAHLGDPQPETLAPLSAMKKEES